MRSEPQRLAQARLLFLAPLEMYDLLADDAGFAAVLGSGPISLELFDRCITVRRFLIEDELDALGAKARHAMTPDDRYLDDRDRDDSHDRQRHVRKSNRKLWLTLAIIGCLVALGCGGLIVTAIVWGVRTLSTDVPA